VTKSTDDPPGAEFRRFEDVMRKLIAVPKKEIDRQAAAWKRRKNQKKAAARHIVT
jgi:hypothetical protein